MSQDQSGNDPTASSHGPAGQDPTSSPWGSPGADSQPISFDKAPSGSTDATTAIPDPSQNPGWDPNAYGQQPYGQAGYPPPGYGQQPYSGQQQGGWDPNAYPPPGYPQQQYPAYDQQPTYGSYPAYQQAAYPTQAPTNTMAILALIFAFVFPVLGLIFGFVAKSQIRTSGESGDGLAMAGIIISAVFIALFVLFFVFIFGILGAAASSVPYS